MDIHRPTAPTRPLGTTRPLKGSIGAIASPAPREQASFIPRSLTSEMTLPEPSSILKNRPDFLRLAASDTLSSHVLNQLERLAMQPLADGIDRDELLANAIGQILDPSRITQGSKQTCAAAVVQAKLAEDDPGGYLRLVCELASPAGKARLADGEEIQRQENMLKGNGRSLIDNLIQPAFMAFATGDQYDATADQRRTLRGTGQGLYADEQEKLLSAAGREPTTRVNGHGRPAMAALREAVQTGQTVPVVLAVKNPQTGEIKGHSVLVERIQGGSITYLDPHAGRQTVPLSVLQAQLQSMSLPKAQVSAALKPFLAPQDSGMLVGGFWEDVSHAGQAMLNGAGAIVQGAVDLVSKAGHAVAGGVSAVAQGAANLVSGAGQAMSNAGSQLMKATEPYRTFIDEHAGYIRLGIQITCMLVPGLQAISLGFALLDVYDGSKEVWDGIRHGDWKRGVTGVGNVLRGMSAGVGGVGANLLGKAAESLAFGLKSAALLFQSGVELSEGILNTNPGMIMRGLAHAVGGVSGMVGEECRKSYEKLVVFEEKIANYGDQANATVQALMNRDPQGLATAFSLAAAANRDYSNGIAAAIDPLTEKGRVLTNLFNEGSQVLQESLQLGQALQQGGGLLSAVPGAVRLGAHAHRDWQNRHDFELRPDREKTKEATASLNRLAEYAGNFNDLLASQYGRGVFELIKKATYDFDHHWEETPIIAGIKGIENALPGKTPSRRAKEKKQ